MAVIYEKGLVVIPKSVRQAAGLRIGSRIRTRAEPGRVIIESAQDASRRWLEEFERLTATNTMSDQEVERSIQKAEKRRREEMLHVP